jgi:HSP20 family protein
VNITEKDGVLHVDADLPGMDVKDIDVSVVDDMLTLKGERRSEHEETGKNTYRRESRYGLCERTVRLPVRVRADKVTATFSKGVLHIALPVLPEDQQRVTKVQVKGE